jgi:hypothetical protein
MKLGVVFLAVACGSAPLLLAQRAATPVVRVKAASTGQISVSSPSVVLSAICDDAGDVYARPFDEMDGLQSLHVPVQQISPDGKLVRTFGITHALPDDAASRTFSVHDGRVYMLARSKDGLHVVDFSSDGSVNATTKMGLNSFADIFHLAVFKSGEYLLVGLTGKNSRTPFTGVFAADGQLVKKIYEPEDEEASQNAEAGDPKYTPCCGTWGNSFVLDKADVTAGSDGNVYLLHGTSPSLIYVISPAGDVVRKLRIDPGRPDLTANSIKFYEGRLAIGFNWLGDLPKTLIKVIDPQGTPLVDYQIEEAAGDSDPILACYNSEGFTLMPRSAESRFHLIKAKLP